MNINGYTERYTVNTCESEHSVALAKLQNADSLDLFDDDLPVQSSQTNSTVVKVPNSIVPSTTVWHIDSDDMQCYDHDMSRLFSIVTAMFHSDFHCHASMADEFCDDAIHFYESVIKEIFGHRCKEVVHSRKEYYTFKFNLGKSIQSEYQRWEQIFKNIQWASMNPLAVPESEILSFVVENFQDDPRPGISSALASCQSLDLDYKGTMEVILRIASNLSEANGVIRLASVASTEQRYCYQYQKPPHVCKKVG